MKFSQSEGLWLIIFVISNLTVGALIVLYHSFPKYKIMMISISNTLHMGKMELVCIGLSICILINSLMWIYLAYSNSPKAGRNVKNFLAFSQL